MRAGRSRRIRRKGHWIDKDWEVQGRSREGRGRMEEEGGRRRDGKRRRNKRGGNGRGKDWGAE